MRTRAAHLALLAVTSALGTCACSSPDTESPATGNGGASGSAPVQGGATSGAAGSPGGAAGSAGSGASAGLGGGSGGNAPASGHSGQIALFGQLIQNQFQMTARFVESSQGGPACETTSMGPCGASVCDDLPAGTTTFASAGELSVTSPDVTGSVTMSPGADGSYLMWTSTFAKVFSGQGHIDFKASGGAVPAFEGGLELPLLLLLSQPAFVKGTAGIDVPRNQDLALTWTRGMPGLLLYVTGSSKRPDGKPGGAGLTCQFPSELGSGTIPAALLEKLAAETPLRLLTVNSTTVTAGDYSVLLAYGTDVANAEKTVIPGLTVH